MNRILKFERTTLVGGVLFLLPLVVAVISVGKRLAALNPLGIITDGTEVSRK